MLETILIYNGMLFFSILFCYLYENVRTLGLKIIYLFLAFSILYLVAALRYDVGADYLTYIDIYNDLDNYYEDRSLEIGFYLLNKVLYFFNFPAHSIFVLMSFISTIFLFLAGLNFKKTTLFILMYILVFYLNSLNAIRQETAICIILYALSLSLKNKKFWACIFILFASTFHYISLLMIPFLFFPRFNKLLLIIFTCLFFIFLNISFSEIIIQSKILSGSKYEVYLFSETYNVKTEIGSGLGVLAKYFPCILLFFVGSRYFHKRFHKIRNLTLLLNSMLLLSLAISINFYVFHRIVSLFSISLILSIILIYNSNLRLKQLYLLISIFLSIIFFEMDIIVSNKYIEGNKAISPYTTIFSKE